MDFHIHRDELIRALARVQGIVERKSSNPLLSAVLIQARDEEIRITATDKSMTYVSDLSATVLNAGEIAVDAADLFQITKVLPSDVVSIKLADTQRIEIRCGRSLFKLNGHAAADFPPTPALDLPPVLTIHAPELRRMLDQVLFSVAADDNRYGLNGAHIEQITAPDGSRFLRLVGTDGNRLSWSQGPFTGELTIGRKLLLPRKPLAELRKLLDGVDKTVEFAFGERSAVASFPGTRLQMRLLEADFPNYRDVLPQTFKRRAVVERDAFVDALRRVAVFATDGTHSVRFAFSSDALVLTARKLDAGDAREEIAMDLSGEAITVGFNARFITEVMSALPAARIILELGDTLSPCVVRGQEDELARFVVMPVRLE